MKTITLPAGTLHLGIDDIAHYMALSLWPLRDDDSPGDGLDYGFCCATIKAELAQAVESKELPVKDPLTRGPHAHPYGANVLHALVRVDDLRKYVADRGFVVEVAEREAAVQATDTPVVTDGELSVPMSPEFEKWRLRWRAVSFDEKRVNASINELESLHPQTISEFGIRDEKRLSLRAESAQIVGRKEWLALQMGADARREVERSFTLEEMAESRQRLDAVEIAKRATEIVFVNQEIDALIAKFLMTKTAVLADQVEAVEHVPHVDSHLAEQTAPIASAQTATPAKRSRKPSWSQVTMPYMREVYCKGRYKSAVVFYKALLSRADTPNSPFIKLKGELYCGEAGTTVAEGTVGTKWAEIRGK